MKRIFTLIFTDCNGNKKECSFKDEQIVRIQKAINLIMNDHGPKASSVEVAEVRITAESERE